MARGARGTRDADAERTLAIIREEGNHWRAVCGESRKHGSEGGRWERAELIGTSPAAYPTT